MTAAIAAVITKSALTRHWIYKIYSAVFLISLTILIVILGAQVFLRSFVIDWPKISKYFFAGAIIIIFIFLFFQSYQQYRFWLKNDISKHLLPPYTSINYFIFYVFMRFFAPYLMSLIAAILFLLAAKILNKKYEERFFEPEEYYLGAAGIFLSGHPGWLFYAVILMSVYLIFSICYLLFSQRQERLPLYYLWIPTAIFVIIIQRWLEIMPLWSLLKF